MSETFLNAYCFVEPQGNNYIGVAVVNGEEYRTPPKRSYSRAIKEANRLAVVYGAIPSERKGKVLRWK